jgi:adenylate cyclase class IV
LPTNLKTPFEVEIRFQFPNEQEVYTALPFLRSKLRYEGAWETVIYGQELFTAGGLLRLSKVVLDENTRWFLAWKGPDLGDFANIRQELGEEVTKGALESRILRHLKSKKEIKSPQELGLELVSLGYEGFMSFSGNNYVGLYEPQGFDVKLMYCEDIKWPLLVEIEKTAETREEAAYCEQQLRQFCDRFDLLESKVEEEPPTLLYANVVLDNEQG